ncbi:iron-siderophore ABC transporter substrate-binding protein [Agrobacterium vitis]|uniref:iron-siderophore ABC transporter substrate-binding protein n=2 Tax=Agrobacterium vitis TaxID=373 RepID=UPI0012E747DF|nr:iron-siderophore ABC transporter substrate-binding protein [Agrobacterium vitis]MCF1469818.1 iron-siderophore ABC transporter substrate-binding protein [Agrobacterium vitis]MVA38067.1 ABC transporter substrate-binding protein [Agrobacterium vitis]
MVALLRFCLFLLAFLMTGSLAQAACQGTFLTEDVYNPPLCIPAAPKRIVTLDPLITLGMLIELKAPVIATPYMAITESEVLEVVRAEKMVDLGNPKEPSLERVAALKPDLIIGSAEAHSGIFEQAAKIAPTVLFKHMDWKVYLQRLSEVTGREGVAKSALTAYNDRVSAIRERMKDKKLTVSTVRLAPDRFVVFVDGPNAYAPFAVLHEAGVKRTAYETVTDGTIVKRPDWEELANLDGDVLLYVSASGFESGPDDALEKQVTENPLWQLLPAVREGRAHRVDRGPWQSFYGISSANRILDDVERFILTAP